SRSSDSRTRLRPSHGLSRHNPHSNARRHGAADEATMKGLKFTTIGLLSLSLLCAGLLQTYALAAENPQIVDGSKVTFVYQITIPGQAGVTIRDVSEFIQGKHQILPSLEKEMPGMKAGDEKRLELSAEQGFGAYDAAKKKQVSRTELPAGAKEGDVLQ